MGPPTWRVPKERKSRDTKKGGRDCIDDTTTDEEYIHSFPPPWRVPRKRKTGRVAKGGRDCYDPSEGNIYPLRGKEQITLNTSIRFSLLKEEEEGKEDILLTQRRMEPSPARKRLRLICFEDLEDFCKKNNKVVLSHLFDNSISVTYNNKDNLCSGYFPDFIVDPYVDNCILSNDSNGIFIDGPPNCFMDSDKYLQHISNANSKYNNSYFHKMKIEHRIRKKFW